MNNLDTIQLAEVSTNGDSVLFDYTQNGEKKSISIDTETLMIIFNLHNDTEQDPYHYVKVKDRKNNK